MLTMTMWIAGSVAAMAAVLGCAAGGAGASARASGPARPDAARIVYEVDLTGAHTQTVEVAMTVMGVSGPTLDVLLPVWRPGRYAVLDPAGTISRLHAHGASGAPLTVRKVDKSAWRVEAAGERAVTVRYSVYANSLGDRTRHADGSHAFLSPASVFMYVPEHRSEPALVRVRAPEGWRIATGLEPAPGEPGAVVAPDYDVLVDSPLEIGEHELLAFDVDGVPHEIAIWTAGRDVKFDREKMKEDFGKIVRVQRDLWGDMPYARYVFLLHVAPGLGGGTEHLNSTIMQTSPATFEAEDTYRNFLGLVSHEMFHTWNVKRLRPAGLVPYDYQRENYTDLLWVAEGTTSYYDDLMLARAGLLKPDDYLKRVSGLIQSHRTRPGRSVQSVADSSFDAWVKFNRPTPDASNTTVSFYDAGALVSLMLDWEVRQATENRESLDTVLADLYRRFPLKDGGFTSDDLLQVLKERSGRDFTEFFKRHVEGTEELEFERVAGIVGLELVHKPKPKPGTGDTKAGDEASEGDDSEAGSDAPSVESKAYIGMTLEDQGGLAVVKTVLSDGPAHEAGVIPGDAVAAINGVRLRAGDLEKRLKDIGPGGRVRLTLFRHDVLREVEFSAQSRPDAEWVLRRIKEPTEAQRAGYESWIKQAWPEPKASEAEGQAKNEDRARSVPLDGAEGASPATGAHP